MQMEAQGAGPRVSQGLHEQGSSLPMLVLVVSAALTLMGTVALEMSGNQIGATAENCDYATPLYIADAGIARALAALRGKHFAGLAGTLLSEGQRGGRYGRDVSLDPFRSSQNFSRGENTLSVRNNDDGDGDTLRGSDGRLLITCTAVVPDGARRTLEAVPEALAAVTGRTRVIAWREVG